MGRRPPYSDRTSRLQLDETRTKRSYMGDYVDPPEECRWCLEPTFYYTTCSDFQHLNVVAVDCTQFHAGWYVGVEYGSIMTGRSGSAPAPIDWGSDICYFAAPGYEISVIPKIPIRGVDFSHPSDYLKVYWTNNQPGSPLATGRLAIGVELWDPNFEYAMYTLTVISRTGFTSLSEFYAECETYTMQPGKLTLTCTSTPPMGFPTTIDVTLS